MMSRPIAAKEHTCLLCTAIIPKGAEHCAIRTHNAPMRRCCLNHKNAEERMRGQKIDLREDALADDPLWQRKSNKKMKEIILEHLLKPYETPLIEETSEWAKDFMNKWEESLGQMRKKNPEWFDEMGSLKSPALSKEDLDKCLSAFNSGSEEPETPPYEAMTRAIRVGRFPDYEPKWDPEAYRSAMEEHLAEHPPEDIPVSERYRFYADVPSVAPLHLEHQEAFGTNKSTAKPDNFGYNLTAFVGILIACALLLAFAWPHLPRITP